MTNARRCILQVKSYHWYFLVYHKQQEEINMLFNNFGINDEYSFIILFATIVYFLALTPIRNAAVIYQRLGKKRYERSVLNMPYEEEMFALPFWARFILFPWFMFSKRPFLKRTILYRFGILVSTLIMIFVCFLPISATVQGVIFSIYFLSSLALFWIFDQEIRTSYFS